MTVNVAGITVPDSQLAREITELVRDTESELLFHHSSRVYYFAALAGSAAGSATIPSCSIAAACFMTWGSRIGTAARPNDSKWTAPMPPAIL